MSNDDHNYRQDTPRLLEPFTSTIYIDARTPMQDAKLRIEITGGNIEICGILFIVLEAVKLRNSNIWALRVQQKGDYESTSI